MVHLTYLKYTSKLSDCIICKDLQRHEHFFENQLKCHPMTSVIRIFTPTIGSAHPYPDFSTLIHELILSVINKPPPVCYQISNERPPCKACR